MKQFVLSIFTIISLSSMAQTWNWETNDTIIADLAPNTTVQLRMDQTALPNDTVTLGMEVIYNDLPSSWDGMLCIHGQCLGIIAPVGATADMDPITGAEQGYVRLTVNPMNDIVTAKLQVNIYDVEIPSYTETATWLLNQSAGEGELTIISTEMYPNPSDDFIHITISEELTSVSVVNMAGDLVIDAVDAMAYQLELNVQDLAPGTYKVLISTVKGDVVRTFVKH